ncbi:hypothetical protein N7G274_009501 [Stereocaulon virgatum]|uniref:FAD-binding domain-containing protein n=1 Tax=Stereocaulon virgatum TaxID=373712 RepID=A0ABR3ZYL0_9LECA
MTSFKRKFHVVVVGAGLAGLATAILLCKAGYKVTVLEQDAELREIGAGIQLPTNANKVLIEMGILDKILEQAVQPRAVMLYSYQSGTVLSTLGLDPYVQDTYGVPHLVMHRADLRQILFDEAEAQDVCVHLATKIIPAQIDAVNGSIVLMTGEVIMADLIIGADGGSSRCRQLLLQEPQMSRTSARIGNRIVIKSEVMLQDQLLRDLVSTPSIHVWMGPECLAVCYLLKGAFNITLTHPPNEDEEIFLGPRPVDVVEMRSRFSKWDPRIRALLEKADAFQKWMFFEPQEIQTWVHPSGKLTLIGDAAHETLPYLAQGAAMCFESASTLANLLAKAKQPSQILGLLGLYNSARQSRTNHVRRASKRMEDVWHLPNGALQVDRDRRLMNEIPTAGYPNMLADPFFQAWLWGFDAKAEVENMWTIRGHVSHKEGSEEESAN